MKFIAELHTHSKEYCDHASSTIDEMVEEAKRRGFKYLASTNHGPMLDLETPTYFYIKNTFREYEGIKFLAGVEANVRDMHGGLDLTQRDLLKLDFVVASMHDMTFENHFPDYTKALIAITENPAVDCLGHVIRDPDYSFNVDEVLKAVKANGKLIEFNGWTIISRDSREDAMAHLMDRCAALGVECVVTSDAHGVDRFAEYGDVPKMLEERNFPEHLIINTGEERMEKFLARRKEEKKKAFDELFVV